MKLGITVSSALRGGLCIASLCWILPATITWAIAAHAPDVNDQKSGDQISVAVGQSVVMDFNPAVQRISVGLNDVVEATAISPTEVLLNGKSQGKTTLVVWQNGGDRQFFNVVVRPDKFAADSRVDAVRRQLQLEFPGSPITVTSDNGSIFLRGHVPDLAGSDRAVQIASTALDSAAPDANAAKPLVGLPVSPVSAGKVVNLLYVDVPAAGKQILLKVRFASVDRTKAKDMGINLFSLGLGNTVGGISTGQFSPPLITGGSGSNSGTGVGSSVTATFSDELNFLAFFPGLNGGADIKALESNGVVEVLAEPNVIAADGKQASFLAGGEYPYPVAQGGSNGSAPTITIMFKEFGVRLNFIPTITPRGSIRLQVAPEVSSLDFTNAVQVSGFRVPAISSRKVKTEVELNEGQTFVIGGLLDNRETETLEKIPFIGDIPVLGKFFQSMTRTKTNTELIVLVTPELVDAIPEGSPKPDLKFPVPFLPANSSVPMRHPDSQPAASSKESLPTSIPVEKLIESQKPEKTLVTDQNFLTTGAGGGASGTTPP